ncbi:hypothetical protein DRQ25_18410 [Candidatus Fermentibacteria bacterium]|nr:MAG: hypothetical protein DRQ25_18410 [Candidatus Fermentibacteria bacterium]
MTVKTKSKFYYDFIVETTGTDINFNEGGSELTATLSPSQYTPTSLAIEIARAMTEVGTQNYICNFSRTNRFFEISASSDFTLLVATGSTSSSGFTLMGFTGSDVGPGSSAESDTATGKAFLPQFMLQNFVDFIDNEGFSSPTVKTTASGEVELVTFGSESFAEMNIIYQTNIAQGNGAPLDNDPSGVENLRDFMRYCITKSPIEFMPDRATPSEFTECFLESTKKSKTGTAFTLKELYSKGLIDYYESGMITLRKV